MLRFDHMPSDFNPIFLFLGDSDDLSELAGLLRDFARQPREIDVREAITDAGGRSQLTLVPGEGLDAPYGLRPAIGGNRYTWMLNSWQADQIAQRVEALTPDELKSANEVLELGLEGEIPVRVSRGEFTDDFLTPQHHLDPDYRANEQA